jgi:hypothetical protein
MATYKMISIFSIPYCPDLNGGIELTFGMVSNEYKKRRLEELMLRMRVPRELTLKKVLNGLNPVSIKNVCEGTIRR